MDVLVIAVGRRWAVQREREAVPLARFDALDEAVEYGRMLADACGSRVVLAEAARRRTSGRRRTV
ncbi:hypothetical protein HC251_08530 [Iamia sp. SCSIO 61187]|uniref:hypothetical protein n=1 Tax=Iamia sp. SCSIO 61187 TaxID=2722752 RepID=UPI001C635494|nr:hypothetical protein [Iamia sp. SCSIO 61187]QYG92482.1 hypothetical protein HC251_08530 [Iamia sp. SCSIO 61187]